MCAETGGILLSPRPAPDDSPLKPEFPARPFFGVEPVILDDKVTANGLFLLLSMFLVFVTYIIYSRPSLSISKEMEDAAIAAGKKKTENLKLKWRFANSHNNYYVLHVTLACVASVSVQFGSKEYQELQAEKNTENPVLRSLLHGNACYAG